MHYRKRRSNHSLYYLVAITLIIIVGLVLSLTVFFQVEEIQVVGDCHYATSQIIQNSGLAKGTNLFRAKTAKGEDAILSRMVYIDTVNIKRSLPSTLIIEVTPSVPTAYVWSQDGWLLVSRSGKILEAFDEPKSDLTQIMGANPVDTAPGAPLTSKDSGKGKVLTSLLETMEKLSFDLDVVDVSDRFNVRALYDSRLTLELGSSGDIADKLAYVQKVIKEGVGTTWEGTLYWRGNREVSYLDRRDTEHYGQGYAMMDIAVAAKTLSEEAEVSESGNSGKKSSETKAAVKNATVETVPTTKAGSPDDNPAEDFGDMIGQASPADTFTEEYDSEEPDRIAEMIGQNKYEEETTIEETEKAFTSGTDPTTAPVTEEPEETTPLIMENSPIREGGGQQSDRSASQETNDMQSSPSRSPIVTEGSGKKDNFPIARP